MSSVASVRSAEGPEREVRNQINVSGGRPSITDAGTAERGIGPHDTHDDQVAAVAQVQWQ